MSVSCGVDVLLDSLHEACDYIPKRAIRYFTDPEPFNGAVGQLIEEMQEILENPDFYVEEESRFLFHAMLILAHLKVESAIPLFEAVGYLPFEAIDVLLGDRLFDSIALSYAELFETVPAQLRSFSENPEIDPAMRSCALQAMMILFGKGVLERSEVVDHCFKLLKNRSEKLPYIYDLIAASSTVLHPHEMIDEIRAAYKEGFIDPNQITLKEVEEMLELNESDVVNSAREELNADLEDLFAHYELCVNKRHAFDRNDPCPCCSGFKYKKCCY